MITVVHIITKLELGGAQENTLYTCERLDRERFRVILIHGEEGLLDQRARAMSNAEVIHLPELIRFVRPKTDARCFRALTRTLRRLRREHSALGHDDRDFIVHTHSSKAGILGRIVAKRVGVPTTVHTIHGFGFYAGQAPMKFRTYLHAEQFVAHFTDAFIAVSRANVAEAEARGILKPRHQVRVIRSGFELGAFREVPKTRVDALRAEFELEKDTEVILSVANLKSQKDPHNLLLATRALLEKRPNVVVLFAGDGELRASMERLIERDGMQKSFRLLGWRRDIPELMALADVVALSSRFEGLPRTAVQALAAQRPFVGTRVDGTPEIIRDGRNGFLVEPRSPEKLAVALERALERRPVDPNDLTVIREWDVDEMVRAQERFYSELTRGDAR